MKHVVKGKFLTYGGRVKWIPFAFPYPSYETEFKTRERLADQLAQLTRNSKDPIVKCIGLEVI